MENTMYGIRPIKGKLAREMYGGLKVFDTLEKAERAAKSYAVYYKYTLPEWEVVKIKIETI